MSRSNYGRRILTKAQRNIHQLENKAIGRELSSRLAPNKETRAADAQLASDLLNRIAILNNRIEKLRAEKRLLKK
jgi:hypothetical protein